MNTYKEICGFYCFFKTCILNQYFFHAGFFIVFSALTLKTWRIGVIFSDKLNVSDVSSLTNTNLLKLAIKLVMVVLMYILMYQIIYVTK